MAWDTDLKGPALEIASTKNSPLRVTAGPGTGKTFALMRRIARLLEEGVNPEKILLITFTRVAAKDLENELRKLKIPNVDLIQKATLHSFCYQILNRSKTLGMIERKPRLLMDFEERFLLEDLNDPKFGTVHTRRKRLDAFVSAWATEQDQAPGWPNSDIDQLFHTSLLEWLKFHRTMLIGEFIPITLKYLRDNPGCSERSEFSYVLVDEYQDLNKAEQSLLDLLSEKASLTIVGDEDQSIYEDFRFAHPEGISKFDKTHQNTYGVPLDECRRCPTRVVDMANSLIQFNKRRQGRKLLPFAGQADGEIHIVQWDSMEEEAEGIANYINNKIKIKEFNSGQVLILSTRRQIGYFIRDALRRRKLSVHSFFNEEELEGNPKLKDGNQAQKAFTLLTLLVDLDDEVALRCWLGFDDTKLCSLEYATLMDYSANQGVSVRTILDTVANGKLSIKGIKKITNRYILLLSELEKLEGKIGRDLIDSLFPEGQIWAEATRLLAQSFLEDWTPETILEKLKTKITQPEMPIDVEYIRVMSLHKSKGLTADHVIIAGLNEGLLPSTLRDDNATFDKQLKYNEEQRRLFYVAITRPKKTLILSNTLMLPRDVAHKMGAKIKNGGDKQFADTMASTFISELGPSAPSPIRGNEWKY